MTTTIDHWADRVDGGDWDRITEELNEYGGALLPRLLTSEEAVRIAGLYEQDEHFRSTWAGTASGRVSTATSPAPSPNRSSS
jgi:hypothetical protein